MMRCPMSRPLRRMRMRTQSPNMMMRMGRLMLMELVLVSWSDRMLPTATNGWRVTVQ